MNASAWLPRSVGALLTVGCLGGVMVYSVSQETPVGQVRGRVLLSENQKPLGHVKVTLVAANDDDENTAASQDEMLPTGVRRIRAVTNANGEFEMSHIPVGTYRLSAASRAHSTKERVLTVTEDETSDISLSLKKSQPDLLVTQQANGFLPSETVYLPVHGYIDGQKPGGRDTLRVRVFRTRFADVLRDPKAAAALGAVSNRYVPTPVLPAALLHPVGGAAPQLISQLEMPITGADIEGFYHQRLKLGSPGPGLYLVDVVHGKNSVCAQMMVSDAALVVKKTRDQLLAYAVDSQTGAPRPGADIRVFKAGKTVGTARTDQQGLAHIALTRSDADDSSARLMTLASLGNSEATVGQYDYDGDSDEAHGDYTVHAYTDRPLYRPGGRVSFKGIARRTLDAGVKYGVPSGEPVDVEVRDPSGERVAQDHLVANRFGSFHSSFELSSEAPTGSYSIVMTIKGEEHTSDFEVVSYRKPEFAVTATPNEKHYSYGDTVEMMVDATYYFGAPVAGAKAHFTVMRAPDWGSMYGDQSDSDDQDDDGTSAGGEYSEDAGEVVQEGDVTLDDNGHAVVRFPAQPRSNDDQNSDESGDTKPDPFSEEPQDQIYTVNMSVTDASQREVEASGQVPVTAGDFRLGVQTQGYFALPHQATSVSIVAKDFDGKPVAGAPVELDTATRRWDEDGSKWLDGQTRKYTATTGANGLATVSVTPENEGVLFLSAGAQDAQKRSIVATQSLWVAGEEGGDFDAQYTDLSLLTDKKRYNSGEVARVLLNSQQRGGTALLTVEGSKLFKAWLVPLSHKSTAFRVPIADDYGPNITLSACMVRGKKFARSEAPLRVVVPKRSIRVAVQSDRAKYHPGDKITYHVQTTDFRGKPVSAELSFGVVDESIYALQEDDPHALRDAFYPNNPNNVETNYSFEPLYLGDVNKAEPTIEARHKFMDTAFWQPDLETDNAGKASVSFQLPDNLTTWRATAVAQTLDTTFGRQTLKVVAAKEFFVRLETPRFFTGGDATRIIGLVHNDTGKDQDATIKIESEGLALTGADTQTIHVAAGEVGRITWPVSTDSAGLNYANIAHLKLSAWTPKGGSDPQWTDAIDTTVPVRPHGRENIVNFVGHIGNEGSATEKLAIDPAAIASASQVTVRITPSVSDALVGSLKYLIGFPYGCTEQTMSRFLPDILVQRTLRLKGAQSPESQAIAKQLPQMVRDSLTRLSRFQHDSGAWGWWQNDDDDPWMTSYVLYGLSQAKAEGYGVNDDMLTRGRAAAVKMLAQKLTKMPPWQTHDWESTRAFTLYAIAGAQPTSQELAQVRAQRNGIVTKGLDAQTLGYLVLLDKELGVTGTAWPELEKHLVTEGDQLLYWKGNGRDEWADWDDNTATALGLRAMVATDPTDSRIPAILSWMMTHRQDDTWGSTRDTAWSLGALCDYLTAGSHADSSKAASEAGAITVRLNKDVLEKYVLAPGKSAGELVLHIPWQKVRASANTLTLQRDGGGEPIFYAVQVKQTIGSDGPLPALTSSLPITVAREYRRLLPVAPGANNWSIQSEPTNGQLKQGDRVRVRLTFNVPTDLSYVLIEDAFPAGCEVTERGSADESSDDWDNWWSNTDVRDDRIAFFARHMAKGKHTIEYNLRAQTPGTYNALPTMLQAMYAPEVRAEAAETRVTIN